MSKITSNIFVGSIHDVTDDFIQENGIDIIINLSNYSYRSSIPVVEYKIPDFPSTLPRVSSYVRQMYDIIKNIASYVTNDRKYLIHCNAGIQRSPTVALGLLMISGYSMEDGIRTIKKARPVAWSTHMTYIYSIIKLDRELVTQQIGDSR